MTIHRLSQTKDPYMELSRKTVERIYKKLNGLRAVDTNAKRSAKNSEATEDKRQFQIVSDLNLSRNSGLVITPLNSVMPDGSTHTRTINSSETTTQVTDEFKTKSISTQVAEFAWVVPPLYTVIEHGHGFEFMLGSEKIADLYIKSSTSLRLRIENQAPTKSFSRQPQAQNQILLVTAESSEGFITSEINFENFRYINRNLVGGGEAWSKYQAEVGLNYLLRTSNDPVGSKYLMVGFAAIRPLGDFTYNYKSSLESIDANAVFILDDFGDQGAYYYADHGSLGIYRSVQALLKDLSETLHVPAENMIMLGSSKGGTAALLHGIAAGAGHVYVGAPQTKIGSFVRKPHPNVLELITGGTTEEDVKCLDTVIYDHVANAIRFPKTTIIVGNADHHYQKHAVPLKDFAAEHGRNVSLKVLNGVPHAEIGRKYRTLLHSYVTRVLANHKEL